MKSDRKPTLVQSRRSLQSSAATPIRSPSSGGSSQVQTPNPTHGFNEKGIRSEYCTLSCQLTALAKMIEKEFGTTCFPENARAGDLMSAKNKSCLFERGKLYDQYSAKRNERLTMKKTCELASAAAVPNLGVKVESARKRETTKKMESLVKPVSTTYSVDRSEHHRYALRSIKKPPLPLTVNVEQSNGGLAERKTRAQRPRKN